MFKTAQAGEDQPEEPSGPLPDFHKSVPRQPSHPQSLEDLLARRDDRASLLSQTTVSEDFESTRGRPFPFRTDSTYTDYQTRELHPSPTKSWKGSPQSSKTELSSMFGGARAPAYEEKKNPKEGFDYRETSGRDSPSILSSRHGPLPVLPEKEKYPKASPRPDPRSSTSGSPQSSLGRRHQAQTSPTKSPGYESPKSRGTPVASPTFRDHRQLVRSERSARSGRSLVPVELRPVVESLIRRVGDRDREVYASLERQERHFSQITAEVLEIKRKLQRHPEFNEVDEEQVPLSLKVPQISSLHLYRSS